MSSYEDKICEAMEYIAEKAVARANYDKTIQATIIKCEDEITGQYKIKYQDSSFYAYAASTDITYSPNTLVYILIPGNDMGSTKTILGTVKKLGTDYLSIVQNAYEVIGINCILSDEKYELCSYNKEQRLTIYDRELGEDNTLIIDNVSAKEYFKNTNNLKIGAIFKTVLDKEQQFKGQYGIYFEIAFRDNATGNIVLRDYVLNSTYVEGNPYKATGNRETFEIFELDGANFEYINKIETFCYGFPLQAEDKPNDIFISELNISGVNIISQELLNTQLLTISTPKGAYFDDNHLDSEIKILEGQVRIKGKVISSGLKAVKYFWFIENASVDIYHEKYNINGGAGWACLNEFKDGDWKPGSYKLEITKAQNPAEITRYKCVVLYNELILSRVQEIKNMSSGYNITIASDSGTKFFYDNGTPTLTCLVNNKEVVDYSYVWAEIDNKNQYIGLPETITENKEYEDAEAGYNTLLASIKAETAMAAASQQQLDEYKQIIDKYNSIQRIKNNKVYKIQMNEIVGFKTYKCSVYNEDLYLGTASIVLTNDLQKKDEYTLIINNGTQVFKYDEAGVSPTSPSLLKPMEIKPLSFTVFNPEGVEVDTDAIDLTQVKWKVPMENTMLTMAETSYGEPTIENNKEVFSGYANLRYGIVSRYNLDKYDNNIELEVKYKDILLTSKTNFSFTKEGEPGTNGTNIVCKIVPNTDNTSIIPMLTKGVLNYQVSGNPKKWFKVQLWENGNELTEEDILKNKGRITWGMLVNKYTTSVSDTSSIIVSDVSNGYFAYNGDKTGSTTNSLSNIVKCTVEYDGMSYYATLPVIIVENNTGTYNISLKENTGFQTVLYTTDGQKPSYTDEVSFELKITKQFENGTAEDTIEDVSELEGENGIIYNWSVGGKLYINKAWIDSKNLTLNTKGCKRNQINAVPVKTFNGECVSNYLRCDLSTMAGGDVGTIIIPIHMLLNRYGNAAINAWDGNSVSIDKNGNGVILAPQVGAGKKEDDNSFTGMLMGQVRESGNNSIETGLFGYKSGTRSIFLDAETGKAIFGVAGKGQIIIDPSDGSALLKSGNYVNKLNGGTGMLIDLSKPEIKFGDESFYLHSDGSLFTSKITATGGTVAGWKLESGASNADYRLYQGNVGMAPYAGKYYAFWAGNSNSNVAPFRVGHDGSMTASSGTIGGWSIGGSTLTSNNGQTVLYNNGSMKGPNWEINSSGVATFNNVIINNEGGSTQMNWGNFKVDTSGKLSASGVDISGAIRASSGSFTGTINATGGTFKGTLESGTIKTDALTIEGTQTLDGDIMFTRVTSVTCLGGTLSVKGAVITMNIKQGLITKCNISAEQTIASTTITTI